MNVTIPHAPVPVFPLTGVFLFPHQLLPLHVFEPRYRQMVGDLLDGPGRLVLASPRRRRDAEGSDLPPVAGLGEIVRHEKLPDGRFMIWVLGLARVQITESPSARLYRFVQCERFVEIDVPEDEVAPLAAALRQATSERLREPLPLPEGAPPALLTDLLLQTLSATPAVLHRAFAEPSVVARAHYALRQSRRNRAADDADGPSLPSDPAT